MPFKQAKNWPGNQFKYILVCSNFSHIKFLNNNIMASENAERLVNVATVGGEQRKMMSSPALTAVIFTYRWFLCPILVSESNTNSTTSALYTNK